MARLFARGAALVVAMASLFGVGCSTQQKSAPALVTNDAGNDGGSTLDVGGATCTGEGCSSACLAAAENHSSIGCEYYAVQMDALYGADNGCFVSFVANTSEQPAHIAVSFYGEDVDIASHVKLPRGSGASLTYDDYDGGAGLAPGDVAIVFLAGPPGATPPDPTKHPDNSPVGCPVEPARSVLTQLHGTGLTNAFHIRTDVPVVAYQMLPYGGGSAAVTGSTLLIPTSAWDTNYVAVGAYGSNSSIDIVAQQDDTTVTILPKVTIDAAGAMPAHAAGTPVDYTLQAGEVLQITQPADLSGSPVQSDKPVALFAGKPCTAVPVDWNYCDHIETQIPPIRALGSEYVGATYRPRTSAEGDPAAHQDPPFRVIGAVDGTTLTFEPSVEAPMHVNLGDVIEFQGGVDPWVVKSQDADHPFVLLSYMTGSEYAATRPQNLDDGYGDPEVVRVVPVPQYLSKYVFFTDPTYPVTHLVVTRKKGDDGFADVTLDCLGTMAGWAPIDAADTYEYVRFDLVNNFATVNGCDNGRHLAQSDAPFGLTVWGWGTPRTKLFTRDVSYGYAAGEKLAPLNTVVIPAKPR